MALKVLNTFLRTTNDVTLRHDRYWDIMDITDIIQYP